MRLSILILTVHGRTNGLLKRLLDIVLPQTEGKPVEVLWLGDNKRMSIGEKRNRLLSLATGDYVVFIDDDDRVSSDYVDLMLAATSRNPDIIVFRSEYTENGKNPRPVYYDIAFSRDVNHDASFDRMPDQKCCVKRDIALSTPFKHVNNDDHFYAIDLYPKIKTQAKINKTIYFHEYNTDVSLSGY